MKTNLILRTTAALQVLLHKVNYEQTNELVSANFVTFFKWLDNQRGFFTPYNSNNKQQLIPLRLRVKK